MNFDNLFIPDDNDATHYDFLSKKKLRLNPGRSTQLFWTRYCSGINNRETGYYGEINDRVVPLIVPFSVSYKDLGAKDIPFKNSLICGICKCIQTVIKNNYIIDDSASETIGIILEKPMYLKNGFVYYDLRFQFPRCKIYISDYNRIIRPELIKVLNDTNIITKFKIQPLSTWDTIIGAYDDNKCILLYGSSTHENIPAEKLIIIYDSTGEESDLETLSEVFDVRDHVNINMMPNNGTGFINTVDAQYAKHEYDWILPIILSTGYRKNYVSVLKRADDEDENLDEADINLPFNARIASAALSMISLNRYNIDSYWKTIGMCLYNIYQGEPSGLACWTKWSNKVEYRKNLPADVFLNEYHNFSHNNPYTELTLIQYAEEDSPSAYYAWHKNQTDAKIIESSKEGTAGSLARAFYLLYWTKYAYWNGSWYEFKNTHMVKLMKEGPAIAVSGLRSVFNEYRKTIVNNPDQGNHRERDKITLEISKIMLRLDDPSFINKVIQSIKFILAKKHERAILNHNWNCMAVHNVVLESQDGEPMLIRKGKLEDYITMCSDTIYDSDLNENSTEVKQYKKFMHQVFHYDSIINYVNCLFSKAQRSHNSEKQVPNFFGPTHGAKTTFKTVMETIFGDYSYTWPTTNVTGRRTQGDTASPTMAAADGKKIVWTEEPEDCDRINEGMYRQESGGGKRHTRRLHENGGEGVATAMHIVVSNNKLRITPKPENKTRFPFIPCTSTFMDKNGDQLNGFVYPESKAERIEKRIYRRINNFNKQIPNIARGGLWCLVQVHNQLDFRSNLVIPPIILKETKKYWKETDPYTIFASCSITKTIDTSIVISDYNLYTAYCNWFGVRAAKRDAPNLSRFMEYMIGVIGPPGKDHNYHGIRLRNSMYDEFIEENIEIGNDSDALSLSILYDTYRKWRERFYPTTPIHNRDLFALYIESSIGPRQGRKGFNGIKLAGSSLFN